MFRLILRLAILPLIFLSAALLLIRAQPYNGNVIREFLMSDGCTTLCFMGIEPGLTKPTDAINHLKSSTMIARVGVSESLQTVAWYWNKDQSSLLDDRQIPAMFYDHNSVSSIRLYTNIRLGDLLLEFGQMPGRQRVAIRRTGPYEAYNVDLYYMGNGYVLNSVVNCRDFWTQPTHLILGVRPQYIETQGYLTTSLNKAKHLIAIICRRINQS